MGLKKNILYSGILSTSVYVFQFITYPYVARVLGVTNIGICNYVQSIVQYFTLFAMLGISTLGVREIAKCNGDRTKLDDTFSKLFTINFALTIVALIAYCIAVLTVSKFAPYKELLWIGASQILFNIFTVEWLFKGVEDFRFITLRTLFVRLLYVVCIFIFVHKESDYTVYFIIYSGMIFANALINWNYRRKFVSFAVKSYREVKKYLRPLTFLGSQLILTSIYTTFSVFFLGWCCGDDQVGYYTTATKIQAVIISLYSAFTVVMMPRISSLLESGNKEEVNKLVNKSIKLLIAFVFPCVCFVEFYAEEIVLLISGSGYELAVTPLRIVTPLLLIIGLEQIFIVQLLMPMSADRQVFINSCIGAFVSIVGNIILVPYLKSIGSAIVWGISELAVLLSAIYFLRKTFVEISFLKDILKYAPSFAILFAIYPFINAMGLYIWIQFFMAFVVTIVFNHLVLTYLYKNEMYISACQLIVSKIHR